MSLTWKIVIAGWVLNFIMWLWDESDAEGKGGEASMSASVEFFLIPIPYLGGVMSIGQRIQNKWWP